jgi:hypothetical protein
MWTIAIIAGVGAVLGGLMLLSSRELRVFQRDAERIAADVFVDPQSRPEVMVGRAYGYPTFRVTFPSKGELGRASSGGLMQAFLGAIQERFKAAGSRKYPFDAVRAVSFTSREELEEVARINKGHQ